MTRSWPQPFIAENGQKSIKFKNGFISCPPEGVYLAQNRSEALLARRKRRVALLSSVERDELHDCEIHEHENYVLTQWNRLKPSDDST